MSMRKLLTSIFALFAIIITTYGQTQIQTDSLKVYFKVNLSDFDSSLGENAASMDLFIDKIRAAMQSGELDHIDVYGYASPDGPWSINERLAHKRSEVIVDYIIKHAGISADKVNNLWGGIAYDELRCLVTADTNIPDRDVVLEILNDDSLGVYEGKGVDRRKQRLMALSGGRPYKWLLRNVFPKLRYSFAIAVSFKPEIPEVDTAAVVVPEPEPATEVIDTVIMVEDTVAPLPAPVEATLEVKPRHLLALKTNLLYYGALMPNLELEYLFNDHWSVAIEGNIAWWGKYARNRSYRLAEIDAEVRRWIKPREPWHGFYVGAFAGGGWYDLLKDSPGYYGEGGMAGLSVGYMWPVSRNLSFEAALGAGYLYSRYKEYEPIDGHHVYQRTKALHYAGPLKAKFSIVWRFLDRNKIKRSNPAL